MNIRCNQQGFTLVEVIGVLTIISVMAAVIVPNVFKQIDRVNQDAEEKNLAALASEMQQLILDQKTIPASAVWADVLAQVSDLPALQVRNNSRGFARGYFVDPRFFSTTDKAFSGFSQSIGLAALPVSPRLMIISNLKADIVDSLNTTAAFEAVWNQSAAAILVEGQDIKIQRMHIGHLFHTLLLQNEKAGNPSYQLDNGPITALPAASNIGISLTTLAVIDGSQIKLYQDPFPTGPLQHNIFLRSNDAFYFGTDTVAWFWGRP